MHVKKVRIWKKNYLELYLKYFLFDLYTETDRAESIF